ncbi:baculoviral IAP repeat-containing protein 3-like [Ylistrum balloti]|uniref:baculoviral IAP repeat-containing protein 3-like n=1 Tax=Ylistrum balloti TaxID=509963 RepID=UPI002905F139|nr:baculoviral IAP repeat-containing protein 3-like [Ylistrum balloti]
MVCVLIEKTVKSMSEDQSHNDSCCWYLFKIRILKRLKLQIMINISKLSHRFCAVRNKCDKTTDRKSKSKQTDEGEMKIFTFRRITEKFAKRRGFHHYICLIKESEIVNRYVIQWQKQDIDLVSVNPLLVKDATVVVSANPLQVQDTKNEPLNAIGDSRETQLRTTIILPYASTDTPDRHTIGEKGIILHFGKISRLKQHIFPQTVTKPCQKEKILSDPEKKRLYSHYTKAYQSVQVYPVLQYSLQQAFDSCAEGRNVITNPEVFFSNYLTRLSSYKNFSSKQAPSAVKLSKAGFYSTGNKYETACFHCGCRYSGWNARDDPIHIHEEISPECEFIQEIVTNEGNDRITGFPLANGTPCSENTDTHTHQHPKESSFIVYGDENDEDSRLSDKRTDISMANSACDFKQEKSYFNDCNGFKCNMLAETKPITTSLSSKFQSLSFDNTPSFASLPVHQNEITSSESESAMAALNGNSDCQMNATEFASSHIVPKDRRGKQKYQDLLHPLFPQFMSILVRISSFAKWPTHVSQSGKQMADAGFFYKGYGDAVVCFWCGVCIFSWEDGDDPWIEHVKWQPICPFTIQNKGQDFIDLILEGQDGSLREDRRVEDFNVAEQTLSRQDDLESHKSTKLKEMGFKQEKIQEAVIKVSRGAGNYSWEDILEQLLNEETTEPESLPTMFPKRDKIPTDSATGHDRIASVDLSDESNHLRRLERLMCKICLTEEVRVTFLPCGHLICCMECSKMVSRCPICRERIETRIKCYIS